MKPVGIVYATTEGHTRRVAEHLAGSLKARGLASVLHDARDARVGPSAFAAIVSPVVSGMVIDATGNWELPFVGSMMLMAIGVILAFRMRPDHKFEDVAAPAPAPAS